MVDTRKPHQSTVQQSKLDDKAVLKIGTEAMLLALACHSIQNYIHLEIVLSLLRNLSHEISHRAANRLRRSKDTHSICAWHSLSETTVITTGALSIAGWTRKASRKTWSNKVSFSLLHHSGQLASHSIDGDDLSYQKAISWATGRGHAVDSDAWSSNEASGLELSVATRRRVMKIL